MPWVAALCGRYVDPDEVGVTVDTYPDTAVEAL